MRIPRATVLLLIVSLALLSVVLRYPLVDHERYQSDSYFIHYLAGELSDQGRAQWVLNPLSYFGYYPVSYPSAVPFLIAELSVATDLSLESTIILCNMFFGILLVLAVFCLSREFTSRTEIALMVVFFVAVGPRLLDSTFWVGSARGPLVVFLVLVILGFMRASTTRSAYLYGVSVLFLALCFSIHHMAVLLTVFAIAYVVANFWTVTSSGFRIARSNMALAGYLVAVSVGITIGGFVSYDLFVSNLRSSFEGTYVFDFEPSFLSVLLNMGISYTNQVGLLLPIVALSIPIMFRVRRVSQRTIMLYASVILFAPLSGTSLYVSMILTPFVAIIGVDILKWMVARNPRRQRISYTAISLLMAVSLALAFASLSNWNDREYLSGDGVVVDNIVFNDGAWLRVNCRDSDAISNVQVLSLELGAISGIDILRPGVYSSISGDATKDSVAGNITLADVSFPRNLYLWLDCESELRVEYFVQGLMTKGVSFVLEDSGYNPSARDYFQAHPKLVVVIDNSWPSQYVSEYSVMECNLQGDLVAGLWGASTEGTDAYPLESYMVYKSERTSVFYLGLF